MEFKDYLLVENNILFAARVEDMITALQNLKDDIKNPNKKELAMNIANKMRKAFLRGNKWPKLDGQISTITTVAFNILKSTDAKQENRPDLDSVINSSIIVLNKMLGTLGVPRNQLASPS